MANFRHGQWVKWSGKDEGVHKSADGKLVGIYQAGYNDAFGTYVPEHVAPVNDKGENLIRLVGTQVEVASVNPAKAQGLEAANRIDIPAVRIAHLPKDWQPNK